MTRDEVKWQGGPHSVLNRPGRTAGRTGRPAMVQSSPLFWVDCDDPVRDFERTGRPGPNFDWVGLQSRLT
jgi:hypothetical protein